MTPHARGRGGGYAVAAVLLLLVGLMGLAHGALVLAQRERLASALESKLLERRLLARAAARPPAGLDSLPELAGSLVELASGDRPPAHWSTSALPLGRELVLLVGTGRIDGVAREDRTGTLAFALAPEVRMAAASGVVEAGGAIELGGGGVDASGWLTTPDPAAGARCAGELRALDSLGAGVPAPVALLPAPPAGALTAVPALGLLPGDSVVARVPATLAGSAHPAPIAAGGACVDGPENWGSPSDPSGPCGARMVLGAARGDVRVEGGEGQGVLVAAGSVTLVGGRFDGFVLAGGDLVLEAGARLMGAARVGGALRVRDGRVLGSACASARALRAALPLRRAFVLPDAAPVHPL